MPVNDFAVPRMEVSRQRPVQSMEEVRDWERLFVGEIKAGRDPRIRPACKEEPAIINRFKTESEYSRKVEISTLHKVLAILRAAIRWGQAQTPPLIDKSPFSPLRRPAEHQSRNRSRSADFTRGREAAPRRGAGHEHVGAQVCRPADA
jgi:hypothetical protein